MWDIKLITLTLTLTLETLNLCLCLKKFLSTVCFHGQANACRPGLLELCCCCSTGCSGWLILLHDSDSDSTRPLLVCRGPRTWAQANRLCTDLNATLVSNDVLVQITAHNVRPDFGEGREMSLVRFHWNLIDFIVSSLWTAHTRSDAIIQ